MILWMLPKLLAVKAIQQSEPADVPEATMHLDAFTMWPKNVGEFTLIFLPRRYLYRAKIAVFRQTATDS